MSGQQKLIDFTEKNYKKAITKVNDRIYHFLGYGHSNAIAIIGDSSVILIDTLDSDQRSLVLKQEIQKLTDKPIKTIIYTHGHPDHRGGGATFSDTAEEIIAFAPAKAALKYYDRISGILNKRGKYQFGIGLSDDEAISQGIGPREGRATGEGDYAFLNPTTVYNNEIVERNIDGVKMKLVPAIGESDDQIYIWLEEDQVICTGDNYYGCWPNLYAIRGTQYRDIAAWIDTLDEILSYPAKALLPGHTKVLFGDDIKEVVGTFRNAIETVLFKTLDCLNRGCSLSETVELAQLPDEFKNKEYLGEFYGTVEWSVKSIYNGYVGWFDGNPANLLPHSDQAYAKALLGLIGSTDKIMEAIQDYIKKKDYQMALQLIDLASYEEEIEKAKLKALKKEALLNRADQVTSANARHYYIWCAKDL